MAGRVEWGGRREIISVSPPAGLPHLDKEFLVLLEGLKKPLSVSEGGGWDSQERTKCSYLYHKTKFRAATSLLNFPFNNWIYQKVNLVLFLYKKINPSKIKKPSPDNLFQRLSIGLINLNLSYFSLMEYHYISILNPFDVQKELTFLGVYVWTV